MQNLRSGEVDCISGGVCICNYSMGTQQVTSYIEDYIKCRKWCCGKKQALIWGIYKKTNKVSSGWDHLISGRCFDGDLNFSIPSSTKILRVSSVPIYKLY